MEKVEKETGAEKEVGAERVIGAEKEMQAKVPGDTKAAALTVVRKATKQQNAEDPREQPTWLNNPRKSKR